MIKMRLFDLRTEEGLTQKQLANILFLNKHCISSYERGRSQPSNDTLVAIADYFNVSVDYLLGRTEDRYPYKPSERYLRLPLGTTSSDRLLISKFAEFLVKDGKSLNIAKNISK